MLAKNHAEAILRHDFPGETRELVAALADFAVPAEELIGSGGGEARSTQRLRRVLAERGWRKHRFEVALTVDGVVRAVDSHEIDHVRRERPVRWRSRSSGTTRTRFDRDLENFSGARAVRHQPRHHRDPGGSLLAEMEAIVGASCARTASPPDHLGAFGMKRRTDRQVQAVERLAGRGVDFARAFARTFVADKFGAATTHWRKLADRVARGVGNPCPLLLIGLPAGVVRGYSAASDPEL